MKMEMTKYKLGELLTIKNGKDYKHLEVGKFPVFGSGGYMCSINSYLYDKPSILLPRKGTLSNIQFYNKGAFWTVDTCFYSLINEKLVDGYYLYRFLRSLDLSGLDTGASIPSMTQKTYNGIKISLPSLFTQRKIASILSAYDSLIENNTKRIRLLEQMAENLYKEWFVRFRFPGYEDTEFVDGMPKGWICERLGKVANISTGKCNREDAETDGKYPLFDRSQEIKRSSVWLKDCEAIIVPGEGTTFIPRYFKGKFNLHQRCYCVEPKIDDIGKFLFYVLLFNRKYFLSVATGATVPSLRQNNFTSMKFLMPELGLCRKFNQFASNIFSEIDSLQHQSSLLTRQRDLLLPRLMSGKLEVKA